MLGSIAGDVIGSVYEFNNIHTTQFPLFTTRSHFTDDTVLTIATADCLINQRSYALTYRKYGRKYPNSGFGGRFYRWIFSDSTEPYNSFGNGSAMRISPVGFAFETLEATLDEAQRSAEVTHNHPEGIKGAQAVAAVIYLARQGVSKSKIMQGVTQRFGYDLSRSLG